MKPFVIITGMHRSGTSFLCRAFNLAGVYIGSIEDLITHDWKPHKSNLRGHWENQEILTLANTTLFQNGGSWDEPPNHITLSKEIKKRIESAVQKLSKNAILAAGFKETRMLILLDQWKEVLPQGFILIGIFRNPLKVAESLKIRSGFDYSKSLKLWQIYNSNLLKYLDDFGGFLFNFDAGKEILLEDIKLALNSLNLYSKVDLEQWYTEDLIRSDKSFDLNYMIDPKINDLYVKLLERSRNNTPIQIDPLSEEDKTMTIYRLLEELQEQGEFFRNNLALRTNQLKL